MSENIISDVAYQNSTVRESSLDDLHTPITSTETNTDAPTIVEDALISAANDASKPELSVNDTEFDDELIALETKYADRYSNEAFTKYCGRNDYPPPCLSDWRVQRNNNKRNHYQDNRYGDRGGYNKRSRYDQSQSNYSRDDRNGQNRHYHHDNRSYSNYNNNRNNQYSQGYN